MYYYILARACMCQNSEVGALKAGGVKEGEAGDSRQEVMGGLADRAKGMVTARRQCLG